jgi:hypothetical protein
MRSSTTASSTLLEPGFDGEHVHESPSVLSRSAGFGSMTPEPASRSPDLREHTDRAEESDRVARELVFAGTGAEIEVVVVVGEVTRRSRVDAHPADGVAFRADGASAPALRHGRFGSEHRRVEAELVGDETRQQEAFTHERLTRGAELVARFGISQELEGASRAFLHRVDQITAAAVLELERDAARAASDDGRPLPQ